MITALRPAEKAGPIKLPFGVWTQEGPRNNILHKSPGLSIGRGTFEGDMSTGQYTQSDSQGAANMQSAHHH